MSCPNGASPLELPITNVTVSDDGKAVSRGIALGVGSPQQIISLGPAIADHDLFIFNAADCGSASNDSCIGLKGGVFDPSKSSTYVVTTEAQWNGTKDPNEVGTGSYIFFNDVVNYGSGGRTPGYPLFMNQPGQGSQSAIPLGSNSSFTKAVVEAAQAPSEVWGMWPGSRNIYDPVDGLLIIGGYDTARVNGDWTTFPTFTDCATCVVISNLTYEYEGGSTSLFANSSETLQVALDPFLHGFSLPQDVFDKFATASLGTYNASLELLTYDLNNPPTGNISVTLSNGFQTTMLAQEIFSKPRTFNEDGVYAIQDDNVLISVASNDTTPGYVASWGMPYLTMNYMVMDHANKHFKMAPARRDADTANSGSLVSTICGPASEPTATNSNSTTSATSAPHHHHSSNAGAIAGGVVGGILGLALIIGGFIYLFWRTKRKHQHQEAQQQNHNKGPMSEGGDTRASIWTSTAPTEYSELASPHQQQGGFAKPNANLNTWLAQHHGDSDEGKMYSTTNEPLEMPADTSSHHH